LLGQRATPGEAQKVDLLMTELAAGSVRSRVEPDGKDPS